jgi:hypothetical protein
MAAADYLGSIDWLGALGLGAILVVVGLVLLRFLLASTAEVSRMLPGARSAADQVLEAGRDLPGDSWVCSTCRSVNTRNARTCYRGCGERDAQTRDLPESRDLIADGHNGGRNR